MTLFKQESFDQASITNEHGEIVDQGKVVQTGLVDIETSLAEKFMLQPPVFSTGPVITIANTPSSEEEGSTAPVMLSVPTVDNPAGQFPTTLRVYGTPKIVLGNSPAPAIEIPVETTTSPTIKAEENLQESTLQSS